MIQPVLQPYVPDALAHSHSQQAYNRTVAGGGAWRSELCDCDCSACCAACWFPSVTTSQLLERTKDSEPSCGCCLARCCCLSGLLPTMILLGGGRFLCDTGNSLDFMCDYFYLEYYRDGFWYYYQVPYFSVYAASAITSSASSRSSYSAASAATCACSTASTATAAATAAAPTGASRV